MYPDFDMGVLKKEYYRTKVCRTALLPLWSFTELFYDLRPCYEAKRIGDPFTFCETGQALSRNDGVFVGNTTPIATQKGCMRVCRCLENPVDSEVTWWTKDKGS
jgi:hypothetical protein